MEIQGDKSQERIGYIAHWWGWLIALPGMLWDKIVHVAKGTKKLGQDDPRRIIHSLKVGLALTLVSTLYYVRPLYDDFGTSGMWGVLTVVVVFEYTAGGTLSKSLNRGFATLLAGALGVGAKHLAGLFEKEVEPIVMGILVFLLGAAATFSRFFPRIKAKYDYGVLIFILTFSLVTVSGYRVDEILTLAHQRLSTIIIGGATCIFISIFICPVWAGETLHNSVAHNVEKLANYLEGFGGEYFRNSQDEGDVEVSKKEKSFLQGYKTVLSSKGTEDSMANLASWEPGHGRFRFRHPWKQYLKVGELARKCACHIEALNGYLYSDVQAPEGFKRTIQEPCMKISSETGKALKLLASTIKEMKHPSSAESHVENAKSAVKDLRLTLKSVAWEYKDQLTIVPATTVASLLVEIVTCVENISESVHELSQLANFKKVEPTVSPEKPHLLHRGSVKPVLDGEGAHVVITINETLSTDHVPNNCNNIAPKHSQLRELVLCK